MPEVNELFAGWDDHPPVYLMVKALVQGFGGAVPAKEADGDEDIANIRLPDHVKQSMLRDASKVSKASAGAIPIQSGDPGLPKAPPVFAVSDLRARNDAAAARIKAKQLEAARERRRNTPRH